MPIDLLRMVDRLVVQPSPRQPLGWRALPSCSKRTRRALSLVLVVQVWPVLLDPPLDIRSVPHLAHLKQLVWVGEVFAGDDLIGALPGHAQAPPDLSGTHQDQPPHVARLDTWGTPENR